jgi:hypothetical protein
MIVHSIVDDSRIFVCQCVSESGHLDHLGCYLPGKDALLGQDFEEVAVVGWCSESFG